VHREAVYRLPYQRAGCWLDLDSWALLHEQGLGGFPRGAGSNRVIAR